MMWSLFADDPVDFATRHLGYRSRALNTTLRRAVLGSRLGLVAPLPKEDIRRAEIALALWKLVTCPEDDVLVGVGLPSLWNGWLKDVDWLLNSGGSHELRQEVHVVNRKVIHRMASFGTVHHFLSNGRPRIPGTRGAAPTLILSGIDRASTETVLECSRQFVPPSLFISSAYPVLSHGLAT